MLSQWNKPRSANRTVSSERRKKCHSGGSFQEGNKNNIKRIKDPETHTVQNCVTIDIHQCRGVGRGSHERWVGGVSLGIFNRNKNVGGGGSREKCPTLMPVKNGKIKVIVCELCLFFPKSKNIAKRKRTHTNQPNQKWGKVVIAIGEESGGRNCRNWDNPVTGAWKFHPMTRPLKVASFRSESGALSSNLGWGREGNGRVGVNALPLRGQICCLKRV